MKVMVIIPGFVMFKGNIIMIVNLEVLLGTQFSLNFILILSIFKRTCTQVYIITCIACIVALFKHPKLLNKKGLLSIKAIFMRPS